MTPNSFVFWALRNPTDGGFSAIHIDRIGGNVGTISERLGNKSPDCSEIVPSGCHTDSWGDSAGGTAGGTPGGSGNRPRELEIHRLA
jgi:hypothetical protein